MGSPLNLLLGYKEKKEGINTVILVVPLIILAMGLNQISQRAEIPLISRASGILRTLIYFALFIAWGLSIRRRIMQRQVRIYLIIISSLMVFWLLLRTIKYFFVSQSMGLFRYLWYAYYIPELLIILMSLFIALSMGKPEDYRLTKWTYILYIPTLTLIGFVLTNDYHQLVFQFEGGIARNSVSYRHNIGFWIVFAWLIICALIALVVVLAKARVPRSRKIIWLPFIPLLFSIIYTFMYVSWPAIISIYINDMTVALCLLIISIFESCIYTGLIRSNRYYSRLFFASNIGMLIIDRQFNICFQSKEAWPLPLETLKLAMDGPINLDRNTRLSSLPITGGYALWLEDVSEMNRLLSQLKEVGKRLAENNELLQLELGLKERRVALEEKDRLYSKVIDAVDTQLRILDNLLSEDNDGITVKGTMIWFYILGAYIKRRTNLIILSEDSDKLFAKELEYSFRESVEAISESGVECFFKRNCQGSIPVTNGLLIYDIFEEIIEYVLPTLDALFIDMTILEGNIKLKLQISYQGQIIGIERLKNYNNLNLACDYMRESWEDDTLRISVKISKGGDGYN